MPIYEFDCHDCGDNFDKLVRGASAISEITCPTCQSANIRKRLSLFSSRGGGASSSPSAAASCSSGGL